MTTRARPRMPMSAHHTASTTSSQLCFRLGLPDWNLAWAGAAISKQAGPAKDAPYSNQNRRL